MYFYALAGPEKWGGLKMSLDALILRKFDLDGNEIYNGDQMFNAQLMDYGAFRMDKEIKNLVFLPQEDGSSRLHLFHLKYLFTFELDSKGKLKDFLNCDFGYHMINLGDALSCTKNVAKKGSTAYLNRIDKETAKDLRVNTFIGKKEDLLLVYNKDKNRVELHFFR
ncbi:MAG: hypothetical protein R2784_16295 [Saprospiraceae bacterium]